MAKESVVQRELKRKKMFFKYEQKRQELMKKIKESSPEDAWNLRLELQKLPRNSSVSRQTSRCFLTGRAHAVYSRFGLSRIKLREYAMRGEIPGVIRSSW